MVVKVSKPEINLREKLSEVDKPSGVAGQAMLAAETPQEQFNMIGAGRRNLLINASFDVSQRGNFNVSASGSAWTSASGVATYGVDRWYAYGNGITTSTQVQQVYLPTGEEVKSLKCTATSASGSSFLHPAQQIEPQFWMEGKTFTLSAWVRTTIPGLKLRMCDTVSCFLLGDEIPSDGQWHYVTGTGTMGTNLNYSASCQFQAAFGFGPVASGEYVEFAKPQMELGKVATPFEYRHYPEELTLCQRYYEHSNGSSNPPVNGADTTSYGAGATSLAPLALWHNASAQGRACVDFKVVKRAEPTMTKIGNSQGYLGYMATGGSAPTSSNSINFNTNIQLNPAGTARALIAIQFTGSPVWGIGGGWIADAEL